MIVNLSIDYTHLFKNLLLMSSSNFMDEMNCGNELLATVDSWYKEIYIVTLMVMAVLLLAALVIAMVVVAVVVAG
jgi:hypothetical protein